MQSPASAGILPCLAFHSCGNAWRAVFVFMTEEEAILRYHVRDTSE
jgi:hypothetical protein